MITALSVTLGLLAAYHLVRAGVAFKPGTFEASGLWILTSFVVGSGGAAAGGFFCATVTRGGDRPNSSRH